MAWKPSDDSGPSRIHPEPEESDFEYTWGSCDKRPYDKKSFGLVQDHRREKK